MSELSNSPDCTENSLKYVSDSGPGTVPNNPKQLWEACEAVRALLSDRNSPLQQGWGLSSVPVKVSN